MTLGRCRGQVKAVIIERVIEASESLGGAGIDLSREIDDSMMKMAFQLHDINMLTLEKCWADTRRESTRPWAQIVK